jgi:hypothetical protein
MSDLASHLERLGLATYAEGLAAEGFDTWEMVLNITESDLSVAFIGECASLKC